MRGSNFTISAYRLITASEKDDYNSSPHVENIDCYIERVDPNIAQMFDERNAFHTYKVFIDSIVDIKTSDKIVDNDGNVYIVHGVSKFPNNLDTSDLMEIVAFEKYT